MVPPRRRARASHRPPPRLRTVRGIRVADAPLAPPTPTSPPALASAAELPHVGLVEALELLLLIRDNEPAKFGRAALRWHGRYCREVPEVDFDEAQAVLAALGALRGPRGKAAARALAELLYRRGMERACEGTPRLGRFESLEKLGA